MTENQPPTSNPQPSVKRPPAGPGPMMVFGLGLLVVAAWCAWDLYSKAYPSDPGAKVEWADRPGTIFMNWGGMFAAVVGAIYCFVQAARRSKKPEVTK